jgi:hypothetical protein
MATPIQTKVAQLRAAGVILGTQVTAEVDAGYGGKMQQFSNFNIYYHAVMGAVAHEVHGGIRAKYLTLGGHGPQPGTGQRLLGFPLTDEVDSDNGRFRVSRFEWGAIYWGFGGVAVYGNLYTHYRNIGGETGRLGYPVSDVLPVSDGKVVYFEGGALYSGTRSQNMVIEISYLYPLMGKPWMLKQSQLGGQPVLKFTHLTSLNTNLAGHLLNELFGNRVFLRETGGTAEVAVGINYLGVTAKPYTPNYHTLTATLAPLPAGATLKHRRLYDFILKVPNQAYPLGAHAVYIRDNWTDFKFIHATDSHVSRRNDLFRKFFRDKGMTDAVNNLNNPNDRFREFIQYANKLWREGNLDFIMITGDLVDYCFEDSRKRYGDDNFVFLEDLILGKTGKPDLVNNEELLVPIFTSLGNHDYRTLPYYPLFKVDSQFPAPNMDFDQYQQFNLNKQEAAALTAGLYNITGMISDETAYNMIRPDRENAKGNLNHYFRKICRETSYLVQLGTHSLVMIDGRWDSGPLEDNWDAFWYWAGAKGEDTSHFVSSAPDSVGFRPIDLTLVNQALQRTGLTIVGVHAPVVNPRHSDYSYFLREQIRASNPAPYANEMRKYVFRRDPNVFYAGSNSTSHFLNLTRSEHMAWSRTNSPYFHEGMGDDMLDYSVMRDLQADFLKLCIGGLTSPRPVDLVFSGHVHKNWECKVKWNAANGKFRFYTDFFTENPAAYYHSVDTDIPADQIATIPKYDWINAETYRDKKRISVKVQITDTATNTEVPVQGSTGWSIKTKPYANTLNAQPNLTATKAWWQNAKPLLVQTSSLGQADSQRVPNPQPDFRGCRVVAVAGDTIQRITYVTMQNIQATLVGLPGGGSTGTGIGGVIK